MCFFVPVQINWRYNSLQTTLLIWRKEPPAPSSNENMVLMHVLHVVGNLHFFQITDI